MKKPKPHSTKRGKRPKSVLKKAWQTRRAKKNQAQAEINRRAAEMMPELNQVLYGDTKSGPAPDAITALLDQYRNEQLCAFVADMGAVRHMHGANSHQPVMVSRPQAEAIEEWLVAQGYTSFGLRNSASGPRANST